MYFLFENYQTIIWIKNIKIQSVTNLYNKTTTKNKNIQS